MRTSIASLLTATIVFWASAACSSRPHNAVTPAEPSGPSVPVNPASEFRPGSATLIPAPPSSKTARGFRIQLASRSAISTPAVYEGVLLVSGGFSSKELFAYEAGSGRPLWGLKLSDNGPSNAACEHGICVFNTESCTIFAIEAATGKHRWSHWLGDPQTSAPTIANGRVFTAYPRSAPIDGYRPADSSHALAAFELETGALLWQVWLDADVMSAPVAAGDLIYVTTFRGTILKIDQATGTIHDAHDARATSAPVVQLAAESAGEQLYYTRREHGHESLVRFDQGAAKPTWTGARKLALYIDSTIQRASAYFKQSRKLDIANSIKLVEHFTRHANRQVGTMSIASMQAFQGSRAVLLADRSVGTRGDEVIATSNDTGKVLWKLELPGELTEGGFLGTAPLAAGPHILVATLRGEVLLIDPASGTPTARYPVGAPVRSQPVVVDGWIYVATDDGQLIAINTDDRTLTGWPTWGGNAQRTGIAR